MISHRVHLVSNHCPIGRKLPRELTYYTPNPCGGSARFHNGLRAKVNGSDVKSGRELGRDSTFSDTSVTG